MGPLWVNDHWGGKAFTKNNPLCFILALVWEQTKAFVLRLGENVLPELEAVKIRT